MYASSHILEKQSAVFLGYCSRNDSEYSKTLVSTRRSIKLNYVYNFYKLSTKELAIPGTGLLWVCAFQCIAVNSQYHSKHVEIVFSKCFIITIHHNIMVVAALNGLNIPII